MSTKEELLKGLKEGVIEFDEDTTVKCAEEWIKEGHDASEGIFDGLAAGMEVVGDLFAKSEYFVPEVLMCADALYAGLDLLKPHVKGGEDESKMKGEAVIGTVEGDVHDIGKNIVKLMFEVAGFTVHDLGKDVPLDQFVEEQMRTDSDLVCLSAMMTTTMVGMKKVISNMREKNPNVKILLGGAPVTGDIADKWGADGYGDDASNALTEAINMVSSLKELRKSGEL
jgi:corrinoid protein of di/trimethylamine methyltransferase